MTGAIPYEGPGMSPVRLYLRGEQAAIQDIVLALQDAAADAQRTINRLETKNGIGSIVRRNQLMMVRRELATVQNELWREVGKRIRANSPGIADAAAEAERQIQELLFRSAGYAEPSALVQAQREYARATVKTFLARGEDGIGLSQRVYRTSQLAKGLVDRQINRVILQGGSWQDIAKAVRPMIDPDVKGGVSYAAKRLGRTELNNAFHVAQKNLADENPYVNGMKWNLSRSHPKADKCDNLANGSSKGRKKGIYNKGQVPSKPHPQCLCYCTEETISEEEFLNKITGTSPDVVARGYAQAARTA